MCFKNLYESRLQSYFIILMISGILFKKKKKNTCVSLLGKKKKKKDERSSVLVKRFATNLRFFVGGVGGREIAHKGAARGKARDESDARTDQRARRRSLDGVRAIGFHRAPLARTWHEAASCSRVPELVFEG